MNTDNDSNYITNMMTSGLINILIDCEKCHLREKCINRSFGCHNYKAYKADQEV